MTPDGQGTYFVSSIAPQTAYTPFVHQIEQSGSTFVYLGIPVANVAAFRAEAQLQGAASVKAWVCSFECYDKALAADGGSAVDGQLITSPTLPFEEAGSVPEPPATCRPSGVTTPTASVCRPGRRASCSATSSGRW